MDSTTTGTGPASAQAVEASALPELGTAPPRRQIDIEFSGSGSEYFRIWIVNLLLSLVTLSLYLPFAKARRLSYFYANTSIDGQALAFHGNPWRMFRGFVLLAVLMGAYAVAGKLSPLAGLIAFGLLCAAWPALWRASLQFRLSNTSWRGLRFGFRGDLAGAYRSLLPLYIPSIVIVVGQYFWDPGSEVTTRQSNVLSGASLGLGLLLVFVLMPWGLALLKRYQHGGYAYASQQTALAVPTRRFYGLGLKGMLLMMAPIVLMGVAAAIFIPALKAAGPNKSVTIVLITIAAMLGYFLILALGTPYFAARMQNLVWNGTHSAALRFDSRLHFRSLAWLTIKNWLLTALTLGLYRPFAAINTARLRLQAVNIVVDGDIDAWVAEHSAAQQDAAGDAAGDFFGIDIGL